ncbi:hypothetical protein BDV25DRAFT_160203 [Aspergillus avenaceus]|uniref:Uncharacterized protein n=1 Tax=Aspergillus avenaceus TaxID=36643 RepID=A0A5N6TN42_ASPAV|nr:hypothetical protein BDV25DRAFT_160203 [Aspergillus avenaceus]
MNPNPRPLHPHHAPQRHRIPLLKLPHDNPRRRGHDLDLIVCAVAEVVNMVEGRCCIRV